MIPHVLYATIVQPTMIWGIPRIALMFSVAISLPPIPLFGLFINPIVGLFAAAIIFVFSWIAMKIVSIHDPDYVLIAVARFRHLQRTAKYVA